MKDTSDDRAEAPAPPACSSVVAAVLLDATPDWERVAAVLAPGNHESPNFRHRLVELPIGLPSPRWSGDPDSDPPWHLERFTLHAPAKFDEVLAYAGTTSAPADGERPRWELTLLDGLDGGQSALVLRLRHLVSSSVSGRADSMLSWARSVSEQGAESVRTAAHLFTAVGTGLFKTILGRAEDGTEHRPAPPSPRLHVLDADLHALRAVCERVGCRLSSGSTAALIAACAEYDRLYGRDDEPLRLLVPGPHGRAIPLVLDRAASADPLDLMRRLDAVLPAGDPPASPLGRLHPAAGPDVDIAFGSHDLFVSNLPGSHSPLYVGGAKVERYYGFGPAHGAMLTASAMSYRDTYCVGLTVDPTVVTDREAFDACLHDGMDAVLDQVA
ncbi:WS/DGAT domain-containing protein [Rhodococcus sp. Z13]|uniref:WS/DGAT domain-containing protein n=1 Tax=Rhodococcus sacchari TaxID=2962047 RepID=A0ACD4DKG1_9NOCA|nr:wax ester/triacylglycerol synthase domain-containing protein [Rhodococcus sp. Z13]UYP20440.1 WS/DGAT domain-containing protein [Rhodococcus sp. Z13]